MQCLILAGGLGTRLQPITKRTPKTLVRVNGMPFAHHQLTWLARQGVTEVIYSIGYLGQMVKNFVGDGSRWSLRVSYADEGRQLRGTAGAVRLAFDLGLLAPSFLALYGDSYLPIEISRVWVASFAGQKPLMTVFRNDGAWDKSNVLFVNGIVRLYEKGRLDAAKIGMRHIDYGLSVLSRDIIAQCIPSGRVMDLATVFHRLSVTGRLLGFEVTERFYEIGSRSGLADLEAFFRRQGNRLQAPSS